MTLLTLAGFAPAALAEDMAGGDSLPAYAPVAHLEGAVRGHASAHVSGLVRRWADAFRQLYPKVHVQFDDLGYEGAGAKPALFGPTFGLQQEPTYSEFKKRFGYEPVEIPVCWYGLAAYVNDENPLEGGIMLKHVERLFSRSHAPQRWGDLGLGGVWVDRDVEVYAPRDTSLRRLMRREFSWDERGPRQSGLFTFSRAVHWCDRNHEEAIRAVAREVRGLCLASIGVQAKGVRALPIVRESETRPVRPTKENVQNGAYPLAGNLYFTLSHDPTSANELPAALKEFLRFVASREGQAIVADAGLVPLDLDGAKTALAKIGTVLAGEETPWAALIARLRARDDSHDRMGEVEKVAKSASDPPTKAQFLKFSDALAATGMRSVVTIESSKPGATIRYRRASERDGKPRTSSLAKVRIPIGYYQIWTEREGAVTSDKEKFVAIVGKEERIEIRENP